MNVITKKGHERQAWVVDDRWLPRRKAFVDFYQVHYINEDTRPLYDSITDVEIQLTLPDKSVYRFRRSHASPNEAYGWLESVDL